MRLQANDLDKRNHPHQIISRNTMGNCKSKNNLPVNDGAELPFLVDGSGSSSHKEQHFEKIVSVPGSPGTLYHDEICSSSSYSYRSPKKHRKRVSKSKRKIFQRRRGRNKDQSDDEYSDEGSAGPQDHKSPANVNDESFDYGGDSVTLYQYVYRRSWYDAIDFIEQKDGECIADYIDQYKRTCLHWSTMKGASPHFIRTLIQNYPQATSMRDYNGRTPLHMACEFASDQVIFELLAATNVTEVAAQRDFNFMRSLLAEAIVNFRSPGIIDTILRADASQVGLQDFHGCTPFELFIKANLGRLCTHHHHLGLVSTSTSSDATKDNEGGVKSFDLFAVRGPGTNVDDAMKIASALLEAQDRFDREGASSGSAKKKTSCQNLYNNNLLFLAIKNPACPYAFAECILKDKPELGRNRNGEGDLPIHTIFSIRDENTRVYSCDECGTLKQTESLYFFRPSEIRRATNRNVLCTKCIRDGEVSGYIQVNQMAKVNGIVTSLLDLNSHLATEPNRDGDIPLIVALKAGQMWSTGSIKKLIKAYPESLSIKDATTGLLPFQIASVKHNDRFGGVGEVQQINTIFEMLLRWPMAERKAGPMFSSEDDFV